MAVKPAPILKIVQDVDRPVEVEVLAESIAAISAGIKKLLAGPLNEYALVLLIQNAAPSVGKYPKSAVTQREIRAVLQGIASLGKTYLKPKTA